jgi:hypothetical protein
MRNYIDIIKEAFLTESRNVECDIFEFEPGKWYFAYERFEDEDKYMWREEDVDCFGPFNSREEAEHALASDHANPGGHTVFDYADKAQYPQIWHNYAQWIRNAR